MCPRAIAFRDEGVRRLLNAVVKEGVGALQAVDQPDASGIQQGSVDLLFGLPEDRTQCRDLGNVPETGKLLESGLCRARTVALASRT